MSLTAELRSPVVTASGVVSKNDGAYVGYTITVVTAAAVIFLRDGSDNAGAIIDAISIGAAAGANRNLAVPLRFKTGLYIDFNGGTGSVVVHYN